MKKQPIIVLAANVAAGLGAGRLTAQPPTTKPAPPAVPVDPEKEAFLSDLGAAIRLNNQSKVIRMMDEAVGDGKFTNAYIQKTWDMAYNISAGKTEWMADRRDLLQSTFLMKQQQRQISLLEQILVELKKGNASKPK